MISLFIRGGGRSRYPRRNVFPSALQKLLLLKTNGKKAIAAIPNAVQILTSVSKSARRVFCEAKNVASAWN